VSGEPTESFDRKQVFPEGFPVSHTVGVTSDPLAKAVFWGAATEGPVHLRYGHADYWLWKMWTLSSEHSEAQKIWAGYKVQGPLGETFHRVAEKTDLQKLVDAHMEDGAVKATARAILRKLASLTFEPIETKISRDLSLLKTHGVVDSERVAFCIHPAVATPLESLVYQDMFLVMKDGKIIDVAAHAWPIDLKLAMDMRSRMLSPVRYGDHLGVVAGCLGEYIIMRSMSQQFVVPLQDLEPVMIDTKSRKLIGGV
jgi:hypothetical protein